MDQFFVALRAPGVPVVTAVASMPEAAAAAPRELSGADRRALLRRHLDVLRQLAEQAGVPAQAIMRRALVWEAGQIASGPELARPLQPAELREALLGFLRQQGQPEKL